MKSNDKLGWTRTLLIAGIIAINMLAWFYILWPAKNTIMDDKYFSVKTYSVTNSVLPSKVYELTAGERLIWHIPKNCYRFTIPDSIYYGKRSAFLVIVAEGSNFNSWLIDYKMRGGRIPSQKWVPSMELKVLD